MEVLTSNTTKAILKIWNLILQLIKTLINSLKLLRTLKITWPMRPGLKTKKIIAPLLLKAMSAKSPTSRRSLNKYLENRLSFLKMMLRSFSNFKKKFQIKNLKLKNRINKILCLKSKLKFYKIKILMKWKINLIF